MENNKINKTIYPLIFCESKYLAGVLTSAGAFALFLDILAYDIYKDLQGIITAVFFVAIIFIILGIILIFHPVSCLRINEDGLIYQRGKVGWKASWQEVQALYLDHNDLQIKTALGSTRLISLSIIHKRYGVMPDVLSFISQSYIEFAKKIALYENKDGKELIELLEKLSGKRSEQYIVKGWEKIRE